MIGVLNTLPFFQQIQTFALLDEIYLGVKALDTAVEFAEKSDSAYLSAKAYREHVFTAMEALRYSVDSAEALCDARAWPFPKYSELLFGIY